MCVIFYYFYILKMDSSDSEDDCYGNIALKLQRMKNNYIEDKIESTNLLNDSTENKMIDEIVKKANLPAPNQAESSPTKQENEETNDKEDQDTVSLDNILAMSTKRVTRAAAKRASSDSNISEAPVPKKVNRRKRGGKAAQKDANTDKTPDSVSNVPEAPSVQNSAPTVINLRQNNQSSPRGRGRGRGRGGNRNRSRNYYQPSNMFGNMPIYSVGNTDEYPDHSDSQQLFSSKPKSDDVVIVEDTDTMDDNEELSVKVYWQSSEFFKFMIRRFQKLTQVFDYFSKKENVSHDKLLFTFNDRILKPDDTPDTINYSIVKFIDGGIINQSISRLIKDDNNKKNQNGIKIKFQCQNVKKPFETWVGFDEKLSIAMMKCAEHFETALDKLRFYFDGDSISGKTTATDLELEGGECLDVKIIS